jgi:hypothetical protein
MMNGDPYGVDERIKNYFQNLGKPDKDDPQYIFGKGAIETAGLQGMARGMAQMGTVHGKSPSAESFVDSSNKSLQGLGTLAKEPVIDPQVMEYLKAKYKRNDAGLPEYRPISNPLEGNVQGFYDPKNPTNIVEGPKLYDKPQAPREQPFVVELDKSAGKEFAPNQSMILNNDQSIARLEGVISQIEKMPERGAMSRAGSGLVAGSKVEGAVQPDLKLISKQLSEEILKLAEGMKGALSDRDLELLKTSMFDPSLPNAANLSTLRPMLQKVKLAQQELKNRQSYLTKYGTLKGYNPQGAIQMSAQDVQAKDWATKNPNDPRSLEIMNRLNKTYGGGQ